MCTCIGELHGRTDGKNHFFIFLGKHPGTTKITVAEYMNFKAKKDMKENQVSTIWGDWQDPGGLNEKSVSCPEDS